MKLDAKEKNMITIPIIRTGFFSNFKKSLNFIFLPYSVHKIIKVNSRLRIIPN